MYNKRTRRFKKGGAIDDKKAMVLSQIKEVHHHADELAKVIANMDTVDAWVVGKMERATTDLSDITHYLDGTTEYAKGGMMAKGGEVISKTRRFTDYDFKKLTEDNFYGTWNSGGKLSYWLIQTEKGNQEVAKFYPSKEKLELLKVHNGFNLDIIIWLHENSFLSNDEYFSVEKILPKKKNKQGIDLFEDYQDIPPKVQKVLDKYQEDIEDGDYKGLEKALKELEKIGYTFEYGLDGIAYDLRPIGTQGKSEFMEF